MPLNAVSMAIMLFFMADPIGCVPTIVALVKDFEFRRQRWILFRESLISLGIVFLFLFLGNAFLHTILIKPFAVEISGGILTLLVALRMIFPEQTDESTPQAIAQEPFVFPIATPMISGGGIFALVLILSKQAPLAEVCFAIVLAWIPLIAIVVASSYFLKLLGRRGLIVTEQLMGMLLLMFSVGLVLSGLHEFHQGTLAASSTSEQVLLAPADSSW
jgi:multiple antibiotic resistance protein